jgi:hypothetical protein
MAKDGDDSAKTLFGHNDLSDAKGQTGEVRITADQ